MLNNLIVQYIIISGINRHIDWGINEVRFIQRFLNKHFGSGEYRIHVFGKSEEKHDLIWAGTVPSLRNIVIFQDENNFRRVDHLYSIFPNRHYCVNCATLVSRKISHSCFYNCRQCSRSSLICKPDPSVLIHCTDCGVTFSSQSCFYSHKKSEYGRSKRCQQIICCQDCLKIYNKNHLNGEV